MQQTIVVVLQAANLTNLLLTEYKRQPGTHGPQTLDVPKTILKDNYSSAVFGPALF